MPVKSVSIRIEEEMLKKLTYVADYEGRSLNSHLLVLIRTAPSKGPSTRDSTSNPADTCKQEQHPPTPSRARC